MMNDPDRLTGIVKRDKEGIVLHPGQGNSVSIPCRHSILPVIRVIAPSSV